MSEGRNPPVVGDLLLHPLVVAAVLLTALNDGVLKAAMPGWLTGKLSDVAGLVFFPLLACSLLQLAFAAWARLRTTRVPRELTRSHVAVAVLLTALGFSAINTSEFASRAYEAVVGVVVRALWPSGLVVNTVDPTDLLALPFLAVPYLIARRRLAWQRAAAPQLARRFARGGAE